MRATLAAARLKLQTLLDLPAGEAAIEAQALLSQVMDGVSRAWMICHEEQALTPDQQAGFDALLQRRLQGEPIAYILGRREFYGLDLSVSPAVLIPRPDTETLVDAALLHIPVDQACHALDLGTGSGAIAIAIAMHRPQARVTAVDYSQATVSVARSNATRLEVSNLQLLQSDWFDAVTGVLFDVIVSNPPYIAATDPHLAQGDLRFEPSAALSSGADGLDAIRRIVAQAPAHLKTDGWLLLEHGHDQAGPVAGLLLAAGFESVSHVRDLAGIQRVTQGRKG